MARTGRAGTGGICCHVLSRGNAPRVASRDDDEPFDEKMHRLTATLREQFAESGRLEAAINGNLRGLGYDA